MGFPWAWGHALRASLSPPALTLAVGLALLGGLTSTYLGWGGTLVSALAVARAGLRGSLGFPRWSELRTDARALGRVAPGGVLVAALLLAPLIVVLLVGAFSEREARDLLGPYFLVLMLGILLPLGAALLPPCLLLVADGASPVDALTPAFVRRELVGLGSDRMGARVVYAFGLGALLLLKMVIAEVPAAGNVLGRVPFAWFHLLSAHLWGYALYRSRAVAVTS